MKKISQKMYIALTRGEVPAEVAHRISEATEFLGDSTEESNERDNYDILLAARAISSLVKRHKDITPIMPKIEEEISTEMTRVSEAVKPAEAEAPIVKSPIKKKESLLAKVRKTSAEMQNFLSWFVPTAAYILLPLLTVAFIALAVISVAAIIATTIAGILFFIIGLLYGVSQFSVFAGAAFFEIGLGLLGGGLAILASILIYNFLTRTLPYCLKEGNKKLKEIISDFNAFRRELKKKA